MTQPATEPKIYKATHTGPAYVLVHTDGGRIKRRLFFAHSEETNRRNAEKALKKLTDTKP